MSKMFSSPKTPDLPTEEDEEDQEEKDLEAVKDDLLNQRKKLRSRRGRAATILTKMTKTGTLLGGG